MLIRRDITEEASETKLSDCELLLRKYLDTKYAQIDTLFVLAQVFERHDNNASKLSRLVKLCQIDFYFSLAVRGNLVFIYLF